MPVVHLFDFSGRDHGISLFDCWFNLVKEAQDANTLLRCDYRNRLEEAVVVRTSGREVEAKDTLGLSDDLKFLIPMARKRSWNVDIFSADHKSLHEYIRRQIDEVITPTSHPNRFLKRRLYD